jgi:two-component system nitrogen regulation response regulator NtrX
VLELFDRPGGFRDEDRKSATAAAEIGAELLRQALAERAVRRTLFDAVAAALDATQKLTAADGPLATGAAETAPPAAVLDRLRADLESARSSTVGGEAALRLAEAVRELAVRHGEPAVEHCILLVQSVRELLNGLS